MVFELTAGLGAICGVLHRLGKLGFIPNYGYEKGKVQSAGMKLLLWIHVLAFIGIIGDFESFESGLLFGLVFLGAWKISEEAAEFVVDCF